MLFILDGIFSTLGLLNVEYNKKKCLNSLSNLFQETTDMHVDVHVLYTYAADQPGHPRDKLDLSVNRRVG